MKQDYEIERKYLIKKPDVAMLNTTSDRIINITQAYIGQNTDGFNCRVRKSVEGNTITYYYTEKKNINNIKRIENECQIDEATYFQLFSRRLKNRNIIEKTRYVISKNGFNYEIDIFPFWKNQAVMEVELADENIIPEELLGIEILADVTFEKEYSNFAISFDIPDEII